MSSRIELIPRYGAAILVPYTELHPETARLLDVHALGAMLLRLDERDDRDYARVLAAVWRGPGDLIVIEQDIGINYAVLPEFKRCRDLWCGHAYPVQGRPVLSLGCVRFTGELRRKEPDLMDAATGTDVDGFGPGHWRRLDVAVSRELWKRGYAPHRHFPDVDHFHEY